MENRLERSAIVVAHPDDEVLWFSSVLEESEKIVPCFLNSRAHPEWGKARKKSLNEYPLKNIELIDLEQADVFNRADWNSPVDTEFGLELRKKGFVEENYKRNFELLKGRLHTKLVSCKNVFTHNPWGEYGHEEHIQVYKAVKELQEKLGFRLWFSNYCSNKTFGLMLQKLEGKRVTYSVGQTNKKLANRIMQIYSRNGCWT